jgi:hypothetical protein
MVDPVDDGGAVDDQPKSQSYRDQYQNISKDRAGFSIAGEAAAQACVVGSRSLFHSIIQTQEPSLLASYVPQGKAFDIRLGGSPFRDPVCLFSKHTPGRRSSRESANGEELSVYICRETGAGPSGPALETGCKDS